MSLIGLKETVATRGVSFNRTSRLPNCVQSRCSDTAHFDTLSLKIAEVVMVNFTAITNLLLIIAIISAKKLNGSSFFKLVTMLATLFLLHSLSALVLKILPLFLSYSFPYQLDASLYIDIFTSYYSMLLILLLSLDRFFMFMAKPIGEFLFSRCGFWILPIGAFIVSAAATVAVILADDVTRKYVPGLGFADFAASETTSMVVNYVFIAMTFLSLCLHILIYLWMRKTRTRFASTSRDESYKAERRMLIQTVLMGIMQLLFSSLFVLIPLINIEGNALFFIISLYNILCSTPELLISIFLLLTSKDLRQSIARMIFHEKTTIESATKTHSKVAVAVV